MKSNRKSNRKSSKKHIKPKGMSCKEFLQKKIAINIREFKNGNKKIKSIPQAIAISYSQVRKSNPKCRL